MPANRRARIRLVAVALLGVPSMFAGCHCRSCSGSHGAAPAGSASAAASASALPKRKRSTHLRPLSGPAERRLGDGAAVEVPVGATDSRPVLIVLSSDDAGTTCRSWRGLSQGYGFVVCPGTGASKDGGGPVSDVASTEKALRAALHALKRVFGDYISPGPVVVAGLGPGARLALSLVKQEPAYFARVVLDNGAFPEWSSGVATIFARQGGKRALFVCTHPGCATAAHDAAVLSRRAGVKARSVRPVDGGPDAELSSAAFAWLIEDDAAWKPPGSAPR